MSHAIEMPGNADEVPGEHVTINQVIGYNVARWRKAAKLTQAEFGERMGGWSNATVSAAEKSWDGKRIRQFTADDIVALALALDLPIAAFFLPPDDDGAGVRYLFHAHERGADCSDMAVLFGLLVIDSTGEGAAEEEWQSALSRAVSRYLDPERGAELISYLEDMTDSEQRAQRLRRIQAQRAAVLELVADLDQIALAIETGDRQ